MSSSIAIPTPSSSGAAMSHHLRHHHRHHLRSLDAGVGPSSAMHTSTGMSPSPSSSSSSSSSSPSSSAHSPAPSFDSRFSGSPAKRQGLLHQRRPSLLSSAISKQEAQVINIGDPDGPPRLISYLSSGQGFTWNPEIFVPSFVDYEYTPLENRREPVHEIVLSDEEAANMFPK